MREGNDARRPLRVGTEGRSSHPMIHHYNPFTTCISQWRDKTMEAVVMSLYGLGHHQEGGERGAREGNDARRPLRVGTDERRGSAIL